jgi:hypothetical protein
MFGRARHLECDLMAQHDVVAELNGQAFRALCSRKVRASVSSVFRLSFLSSSFLLGLGSWVLGLGSWVLGLGLTLKVTPRPSP